MSLFVNGCRLSDIKRRKELSFKHNNNKLKLKTPYFLTLFLKYSLIVSRSSTVSTLILLMFISIQ